MVLLLDYPDLYLAWGGFSFADSWLVWCFASSWQSKELMWCVSLGLFNERATKMLSPWYLPCSVSAEVMQVPSFFQSGCRMRYIVMLYDSNKNPLSSTARRFVHKWSSFFQCLNAQSVVHLICVQSRTVILPHLPSVKSLGFKLIGVFGDLFLL